MKKIIFSILVAVGASFIVPQATNAKNLATTDGYEIEIIYNKSDKTTTVILYKDGVEVGRETSPAN